MKAMLTLKSFDVLPSGAAQIAVGGLPANKSSPPQLATGSVPVLDLLPDGSAERFREMLHRRSTAPFADTIPYRRCGICE